mmetsp:Transcript_85899/g.247932  ORF Transcript_85899/g.247932 Transcript_85899/m.247932 type:complete len:259 (+) Transcript_85899:115-891(+)
MRSRTTGTRRARPAATSRLATPAMIASPPRAATLRPSTGTAMAPWMCRGKLVALQAAISAGARRRLYPSRIRTRGSSADSRRHAAAANAPSPHGVANETWTGCASRSAYPLTARTTKSFGVGKKIAARRARAPPMRRLRKMARQPMVAMLLAGQTWTMSKLVSKRRLWRRTRTRGKMRPRRRRRRRRKRKPGWTGSLSLPLARRGAMDVLKESRQLQCHSRRKRSRGPRTTRRRPRWGARGARRMKSRRSASGMKAQM